MEWGQVGVGWRSVLTGEVNRWGVTQEEQHEALLLHLTLSTTNQSRMSFSADYVSVLVLIFTVMLLINWQEIERVNA